MWNHEPRVRPDTTSPIMNKIFEIQAHIMCFGCVRQRNEELQNVRTQNPLTPLRIKESVLALAQNEIISIETLRKFSTSKSRTIFGQ